MSARSSRRASPALALSLVAHAAAMVLVPMPAPAPLPEAAAPEVVALARIQTTPPPAPPVTTRPPPAPRPTPEAPPPAPEGTVAATDDAPREPPLEPAEDAPPPDDPPPEDTDATDLADEPPVEDDVPTAEDGPPSVDPRGATGPFASAGSAMPGGAIPASDALRPPVLRRSVPPRYPPRARARGIEGTVLVRIVVGTDGRVAPDAVRVLRSMPQLDAAAVASVTRWRFEPALGPSGEPVRVYVDVPLQFSLE